MSKKISIPPDFNWIMYLKINKDLCKDNKLNKKEATQHYLEHGIKENRLYKFDKNTIPIDFKWREYILLNQDLKGIDNEIDALSHYFKYGVNENRKYSKKQCSAFDKKKIINTYINNRNKIIIDNTLYDIDGKFDFLHYYYSNKDLISKINNSMKNVYNHYLKYGKNENRTLHNNNYLQKIIKLLLMIKNRTINSDSNLSEIINSLYTNNINYKNFLDKEKTNYEKKYNVENYESITYNDCSIRDFTISKIIPTKVVHELSNNFIVVIDFPKLGGGTSFFIDSILNRYKNYQTFVIFRNINNKIIITINDEYVYECDDYTLFLQKYYNNIIKIFVNHILFHSNEFLKQIVELKKEITVITHDYSLISDCSQPYYFSLIDSICNKDKCNIILENADNVIVQNSANEDIFSKFIKKNLIITPLPDFKDRDKKISFNFTDKIKIAVIGIIQEIKGKLFLDFLIEYINNNKLNIELVFLGSININYSNQYEYSTINDFNDLLNKHKPNLILETSIWPETYSYTLTLAMLTDLPILVFDKMYKSVIKNRLLSYKKHYLFNNLDSFLNLVKTKKQDYFYTIKPYIYYNSFWDNYFIKNIKKIEEKSVNIYKNNIKIFPIYFPQFHSIEENNISFYKNYNDITNLNILKNTNNIELIETPNLDAFGIKNIVHYNLTNISIIQKQIDILKLYNLNGFAIYYYWFDINTITNSNIIMKNCIDLFFSGKLDLKQRKIFFIWANENWSGNPAFGNLNHKIENIYNNFDKISKNLINYFSNDIYYKENNKPVMYIYHPWLINDPKIKEFYTELNKLCIKNGFNGFKLYLNTFNKKYVDYDNFYINFNYKYSNFREKINGQYYLDYEVYLKNKSNFEKCTQTLVFDFDNRARLCLPNKLELSTICVKNNDYNKKLFIDKILDLYNNSSDNNILLVNAWNEWGEKMHIEPSQENGFYYLNLIYYNTILLNDNIIKKYNTLFHKYIYNFSSIEDNINIKVFNEVNLINEFLTHIHCYDLNLFTKYFGDIINDCLLETNVIVTFCINNNSIINNFKNIVFLEIKNKGYDIGGKICFLKYIYDKKISFKNIFFLHSKNNNEKRNKYFLPLVRNSQQIKKIKNLFESKPFLYGVFPDLLIDTNIEQYKNFMNGTIDYRNELLNFLECNNRNKSFIEGNVMVLNKKIIDYVFYGKLEIFYNLLNDEKSIDLNWMRYNYYLNKNYGDICIDNVYKNYLLNKIDYPFTNDFQALKENKALRDCMIEHAFERIWLNIILHLNGEYSIQY
jgi:hypothetical protein